MKKFLKLIAFAFVFYTNFTGLTEAQTSRNPCYTSGATTTQGITNCIGVGTTTPLPSGQFTFDGANWAASAGLLVGTAGAPGADVVTVQPPITSGSAGFPTASTPISGNAAGTTGAVVGTLAAAVGKTTYVCGFSISALGTANSVGPITIAGLITASQVYQASTLASGVEYSKTLNFNPCIPASATNTAITITTTANGTATAVNVNSWGFQQ